MPQTNSTRLLLALLLASSTVAAAGARIPKGWHQFKSRKGGYAAYYPGSWHVLAPSPPTLYISSFPPSRSVRAVIVPEDGATISVAPPPAGVTSIAQWIARASAVTPVQSKQSFTIERTGPKAELTVTEVLHERTEGPRTTSWYFNLSGHLLVANLSLEGRPERSEISRGSPANGATDHTSAAGVGSRFCRVAAADPGFGGAHAELPDQSTGSEPGIARPRF